MKARSLVIAYFLTSFVVLCSARLLNHLPTGLSLTIDCLLGPIGAVQYLGLNFLPFFKPALTLYLSATLLLGGCLFLVSRRRRSLWAIGYILALAVWVFCAYIMFQLHYYGS